MLDAEQRKFVSGTSSNFLVTQRQNAVRLAQQSELNAVIRHRQARTNLDRAKGVLLQERRIELSSN